MRLPTNLRWKSTGRTLGEGGQGKVIEVTDQDSGKEDRFALKALSIGKPQKAYERFAREIKAIKLINHQSIIRIHDHSEALADFHYYVMDFIPESVSLKKLIGTEENIFYKNTLKSINLFMQIVEAISVISRQNVVHRDLSPANILLLPDESIKIIDFGICQVDEHETITLTDEGVGTPNYMAPECESGSTGKVTHHADLYSAGKIMWSMITNQFAFARESPVFNNKSMNELFAESPETWHLHHLFEKTIRRSPENRFNDPHDALALAWRVKFLVENGYLPLERIGDLCPICGFGSLKSFENAHMVFGNPNPADIASWQCDYCGFSFPVNIDRHKALRLRKGLE